MTRASLGPACAGTNGKRLDTAQCLSVVMPGFMPGIHVFTARKSQDVDGRDEPGHDTREAVQDEPGHDEGESGSPLSRGRTGEEHSPYFSVTVSNSAGMMISSNSQSSE
jgi:hypothetical protein